MPEQPLFLAACYTAHRVLSVTTESLGDGGVAVRGASEQAASTAAATAACNFCFDLPDTNPRE
jgi:hypothetical protein